MSDMDLGEFLEANREYQALIPLEGVDCGQCDRVLMVEPDEQNDATVWECDEIECKCGARNVIGVTGPNPDRSDDGLAYVSVWYCKHDIVGTENCVECSLTKE